MVVKVIHINDRGAETATIELDDFTVQVLHPGIAEILREAVSNQRYPLHVEPSREARRRRISKASRGRHVRA
jgi:hypothetical protein